MLQLLSVHGGSRAPDNLGVTVRHGSCWYLTNLGSGSQSSRSTNGDDIMSPRHNFGFACRQSTRLLSMCRITLGDDKSKLVVVHRIGFGSDGLTPVADHHMALGAPTAAVTHRIQAKGGEFLQGACIGSELCLLPHTQMDTREQKENE